MATQSLQDMLIEELRDLYDAEKQLTKAIPKMVKAAADPVLKAGFSEHLEQTRNQVTRIEQCFEKLGVKPRGKPCSGMKGIVEEGKEQMEQDLSESLMDVALVGAARRVEHYEMAAYDATIAMAKALGQSEIAMLLNETLTEEEQTDRKLSIAGKTLLRTAASEKPAEAPRAKRAT